MISFRETLCQNKKLTLMAIHNAMGARINRRSSFRVSWSSCLEVSAAPGVPHASFLGMHS